MTGTAGGQGCGGPAAAPAGWVPRTFGPLVDEGAKVVFGDILDAEGELVAKEVGDAAR